MTKLYHQLGFRYKWNLLSKEEDDVGNGLIIGPRYMKRSNVASISKELLRESIFDPQFFLPNISRGELSTYPFYPEVISGGFNKDNYVEKYSEASAQQCIDFQIKHGFNYIIIPTSFMSGMPSDYIARQSELFVDPFLKSYTQGRQKVPCLLQLILTDQMLKDENYRTRLLNWITGMQEIDGVYLIYYFDKRGKQISDIDFLYSVMLFIKMLKTAGMTVIVGYLNTESILLLAAEPDGITIGSYENLRMFSLEPFSTSEDDTRRGPHARVYVPKLLQWVEHEYIGAINRAVENLADLLGDNEYLVTMFDPTYNWHFSKPEPYRHYFLGFSKQFMHISSYEGGKRSQLIEESILKAIQYFDDLKDSGIVFEKESSGKHLPMWLTALNQFNNI